MGFRYRKSINLGGGFRINFSKSGIGYSWGFKGFRITKTAKGRIRTTTSIPGTGLSYVTEKSNKNKSINKDSKKVDIPEVATNVNYSNQIEKSINNATTNNSIHKRKTTLDYSSKALKNLSKFFMICGIIFLLLGWLLSFNIFPLGLICVCLGVLNVFISVKYRKYIITKKQQELQNSNYNCKM